jgi:ABC-type nitrate/sulfonate/bicarbonate transport system ATPase subunit
MVGLENIENLKPAELSGGMKKKSCGVYNNRNTFYMMSLLQALIL